MKKLVSLIALLACAVSFASCGGDDSTTTAKKTDSTPIEETTLTNTTTTDSSVHVTGILVHLSASEVLVGEKVTTSIMISPSNADNKEVTYSVDKPTLASIDDKGEITTLDVGTVTITVTSKDNGVYGTAELHIKSKDSSFTFEAEDALIYQAAIKEDENASGKKYIGDLNEETSLRYYVDASLDCTADITFTVAVVDEEDFDKMFYLMINDMMITPNDSTISYEGEKGWLTWGTVTLKDVELKEGRNDIYMYTLGNIHSNIDSMHLLTHGDATFAKHAYDESKEGVDYIFEGEYATIKGCSVVEEVGYHASGNRHLGSITKGATISYSLKSEKEQEVDMLVKICLVSTNHFNEMYAFTLNDQEVTISEDTCVGEISNRWNSYGYLVIKGLTLKEGKNVLKFEAVGANTNFDYIKITAKNSVTLSQKGDQEDPVTGDSYLFEAEDATYTGGIYGVPSIQDNEDCSGGKQVGFFGNNTGATATFNVKAEDEGKAALYASLAFGAKQVDGILDISVNGTLIDIPNTYYDEEANWGHFKEFFFNNITLKKGDNTIVFTVTGGAGNFDYIKLVAPFAISAKQDEEIVPLTGSDTIFEAEDATYTGGIYGVPQVQDNENCSGGKQVGFFGNNTGATASFSFASSEKTKASLYASLAFGSQDVAGIFTVKVNDMEIKIPSSYHDEEANWGHFQEYFLNNIDINKGDNTIVFTVTGGAGNFDYIKLVSEYTFTANK